MSLPETWEQIRKDAAEGELSYEQARLKAWNAGTPIPPRPNPCFIASTPPAEAVIAEDKPESAQDEKRG